MVDVTEHLALVDAIVAGIGRRLPRHVERNDLVQAGRLGLMDAATRFDASKGASFRTFAGWRIRGAVLDELRGLDFFKMRWDNGDRPARVPLYDVPIDASVRDAVFSRWASRRIGTMPPRTRRVLALYYGQALPSSEVGRRLGLSEMRVHQLRAEAVVRLRSSLDRNEGR